jgi:SAM-dependent methyltransferase
VRRGEDAGGARRQDPLAECLTLFELESVPCALCGSNEQDEVLSAPDRDPRGDPTRRFRVVRCRRCGLCFQNPRPAAWRLAGFYQDHYYAYRPSASPLRPGLHTLSHAIERWSKTGIRQAFYGYPCPGGQRTRWLLRLLLWPVWIRMRLLGKDLKVIPYVGSGRFLDLACGTGGDLAYQRQYGWRVTGVEWNPTAARIARDEYGLDVRTGTLEDARFADGAFDVVHLSHVFEHLPDPAATLEELRRVVDRGGLVIFKVPNMASASASRFGAFWLGLDLPRHLYHFTPQTLAALLHRHGFRVRRIRHDIGSWSAWRESARFEARERRGRGLADHWLRNCAYQLAERVACWRRQGSVLVVYASKDDTDTGRRSG